jgi:hypothetical protein
VVTYNEAMRKAVENATPGSYEHAARFWLDYARELRENFLTLSADNRAQLGDEEALPRVADVSGFNEAPGTTTVPADPAKTVVLDVEGFGDPEKLRISPIVRPSVPSPASFCYCSPGEGFGIEHVYGAPGCLDA